MNQSETLADYLERLASAEPTPGGGAAAAVTGAQAAALLQMVCMLSTGEKFAAHQETIDTLRDQLTASRLTFLNLKAEDEAAFNDLMSSYKLPKSNEDEKAVRLAKIREALYLAAKAPMKMIEETLRILPATTRLIHIGNRNLITDVGVGVYLLDATIQSARLNVLINTRLVDNPIFDTECRKVIATAEDIMQKHKHEVSQVMESFL
ncbi:MAG: cyclodeaminase/cyclohydrolase family protein [Gammaproteobacteria bacterium]|nr:cyclodeaminase/cyclohydrolase family protein [Gammaproteobacteria bacterium]